MYGWGRYFMVMAYLLPTAFNSPDVKTSQQLESNDKILSGSLIVFPTRTSKIFETSSKFNPTFIETSSNHDLPEISDAHRTAETITLAGGGLDYGLNIEHTLNDLTRNYYELVPTTKSDIVAAGGNAGSAAVVPSSSWRITSTGSGEGAGAPRSRGLSLLEPQISSTAPLAAVVNNAPRLDNRKTNPDIREFISGFVKYLNGNVPPPQAPPITPIRADRRRINNRGPPKISDLPPLILDPAPPPSLMPPPLPPIHTTHDPPPYPFEKPLEKLEPEQPVIKPFVSGVPIPEQIVPTTEQSTTTTTTSQPISLRPPLRPIKPKPTEKNENKTKDSSKIFVEPTAVSTSTKNTSTTSSEIPMATSTKDINATKVLGVEVSSTVTLVTVPITTTTKSEVNATVNNKTTNVTVNNVTTNVTVNNLTTTTTTTTAPNVTTEIPKTTSTEQISKLNKTSSKNASNSTAVKPTPTEKPVSSTTVPIIESSIVEEISQKGTNRPTKWDQSSITTKYTKGGTSTYSPRPGIVLDDPEYKPGLKQRPIVTAPTKGEIFDVTVSAIHGASSHTGQPVVYPVELEGVSLPGAGNGEVSVITSAEEGQHFVSIDGKRTYISLFGSSETSGIKPTNTQKNPVKATSAGAFGSGSSGSEIRPKRPLHHRRPPQQPPVRIDTCIVGDWSTCDTDQHEICRTEQGVSSCHCAPGYSKHSHRQPCKRVVSVVASVQVEKVYEHKLSWSDKFKDKESQEYLQLEYEANRAIESAMSMTPFSDAFMGSKLNNIYTTPGSINKPVFINLTLQIEESAETLRPQIKGEIQKQLLGAIHRRSNNIGTSLLWATPINSVSHLHDLDECQSPELNDCHIAATCKNVFGSFECQCPHGYKDEFLGNPHKSGRRCETCSSEHCNHRGTCSYNNGMPVCQCVGNYYGSQCEVDGEVLGVAIGASVAAVIIILSTLACLCMWSRKWNKEQKVAGIGSPVFGYMPSGGSTVKTPGIGAPPYQVSLEDRLRWAQIADVMAKSTNHYAPEPVGIPTRPPSALYGYGGTLPIAPMPLPRLGLRPGSAHNTRHDSSSDEEDRTDLLGRNFQVPRPKSRSSIANQSGIYYDVDYDQQAEHFRDSKHPGCIALNTYTMGRSHYYRT